MSLSAILCTCTVIILSLHHHSDDQTVPPNVKTFFFKYVAKFCCQNMDSAKENRCSSNHNHFGTESTSSSSEENYIERNNGNTSPSIKSKDECIRSSKEFTEYIRYVKQKADDTEKKNVIVKEWHKLANIIDRLLFWVCLLAGVVILPAIIFTIIKQ